MTKCASGEAGSLASARRESSWRRRSRTARSASASAASAAQPLSQLVLQLAQALLELGDELVALPLEAGGDLEQPLLDALRAGVGDLRQLLGEHGLRLPREHVHGAVELAGKPPRGVLARGLDRRVELQAAASANRAAACLVVRSSASTCRRSMSTKRAWIRAHDVGLLALDALCELALTGLQPLAHLLRARAGAQRRARRARRGASCDGEPRRPAQLFPELLDRERLKLAGLVDLLAIVLGAASPPRDEAFWRSLELLRARPSAPGASARGRRSSSHSVAPPAPAPLRAAGAAPSRRCRSCSATSRRRSSAICRSSSCRRDSVSARSRASRRWISAACFAPSPRGSRASSSSRARSSSASTSAIRCAASVGGQKSPSLSHRRARSAAASATIATVSATQRSFRRRDRARGRRPLRLPPRTAPNRVESASLGKARQRAAKMAAEQRLGRQLLGDDEVAGQQRERAPGEREPEVGVEAAAEELEVVGEDEEGADRDERRAARASTRGPRRCRSRPPRRSRRRRADQSTAVGIRVAERPAAAARRARARRPRARGRTPPSAASRRSVWSSGASAAPITT